MPDTCQRMGLSNTVREKAEMATPGVDMCAGWYLISYPRTKKGKEKEIKGREERTTGRKSPKQGFDLNSTSGPSTHKSISLLTLLSVFCDMHLLTYDFSPHTPGMQLYHSRSSSTSWPITVFCNSGFIIPERF